MKNYLSIVILTILTNNLVAHGATACATVIIGCSGSTKAGAPGYRYVV